MCAIIKIWSSLGKAKTVEATRCVSCQTLAGEIMPHGGIVYDHAHWVVFLRSRPLLTPGQGFIVLRRHCEVDARAFPPSRHMGCDFFTNSSSFSP